MPPVAGKRLLTTRHDSGGVCSVRLGDIPEKLRGAYRRSRTQARVAAAFVWRRLMLRTTVIAITGSVGSRRRRRLAAILSLDGRTLKTRDNQNDAVGVPRTLLRLRPWHRYAVIEVGTEVPGRIRRSARLVKPHVAVSHSGSEDAHERVRNVGGDRGRESHPARRAREGRNRDPERRRPARTCHGGSGAREGGDRRSFGGRRRHRRERRGGLARPPGFHGGRRLLVPCRCRRSSSVHTGWAPC